MTARPLKTDCGWAVVEGFGSKQQYERFQARISEQVREGLAPQKSVKPHTVASNRVALVPVPWN